jgi:carbamoyl-phosphate synthase large subunit
LRLSQLGFEILATEGTAEILGRNGIEARVVHKYFQGQVTIPGEPSIVELINNGEVDVVINTPSGRSARADGFEIRTATVAADKPLFTTIAQLAAAVASFESIREGFDVRSLQDYAIDRAERLEKAQGLEKTQGLDKAQGRADRDAGAAVSRLA